MALMDVGSDIISVRYEDDFCPRTMEIDHEKDWFLYGGATVWTPSRTFLLESQWKLGTAGRRLFEPPQPRAVRLRVTHARCKNTEPYNLCGFVTCSRTMTNRGDTHAPPLYRFFRDLFTDERGQSEVLGVVLLIGITVIGTVGLVAFGSTAISDTERFVDSQSASHTMGQMSSQTSEVALGDSESQTVELPRGDGAGQSQVVDDGWIKMELVNQTTEETDEVLLNESLGAVVYENDGESVAYQGGGVWKKSGNSSEVVSPPEFHYRGNTLTVPVIQVDGDEHLTGDATVRDNGSEQLLPNEDHTNPFVDGNQRIDVTIQSEYYDAWHDYFDTRADGIPSVDHDNKTVTLSLVAETEEQTVDAGMGATDAGENLVFEGMGADPVADSYNSSVKPYDEHDYDERDNGKIIAAGDVEGNPSAEIRGDVIAGGEVRGAGGGGGGGGGGGPGNNPGGGGGGGGQGPVVTGEIHENADIDAESPVDQYINSTNIRIAGDNDNDPNVITADDELDFDTHDEIRLDAGDYYLENLIVPSGNTLLLEPSGENVTIAVNGFVDVGGEIRVEGGEGRAEIFVQGEETTGGDHLYVNGEITVEGQEAPRMWLYGPRYFSGTLDDNAMYQGVIYAPSGMGTTSKLNADGSQGNPSRVYGGVVTGTATFHTGAMFHYDEALEGEQAVPPDATVIVVNHIHVTLNEIEFED